MVSVTTKRDEVAAALLAGDEVGGDHAEGVAAGGDRGAGDGAHQPDVAGAVDQPQARRGERRCPGPRAAAA